MTRLSPTHELYQQVIIEHSKCPRNFRKVEDATHTAEGHNPLCGDHLTVYLKVSKKRIINAVSFEGDGCSISRASASMMTMVLENKSVDEAHFLFEGFHNLILGCPKTKEEEKCLGKLKVFSGIWQYPSRVKCVSLSWHAMKGALDNDSIY